MVKAQKPVLGFAAYSGTGKTTLLRQLLPILQRRGLRVAVVKHAHHAFEVDQPGKDSYELRKAGASQMLVASGRRWALMVDEFYSGDPKLQDMLNHLDHQALDLILVEGFKHEAFPKIELYRPSLGHATMYPGDPHIVAIATDRKLPEPTGLPVLDLNDLPGMADFVIRWMEQSASG